MFSFLSKFLHRPVDEEKFGNIVLKELQRARPSETFTLDREKFLIQYGGGGRIFLHNVYIDYCRAKPKLRKAQIDILVQGVIAPSVQEISFADAKDHLLPVLRNLSGIDLLRIEGGDDKPLSDAMEFRSLTDELGIGVAIDTELTIVQVGSDALTRWGKTFDELLQVAIDNLRHKAAPSFYQLGPGFFASNYGDHHDAARILIQELIWQLPVGAHPVVMVPNRTCLLVCSAENTEALTILIDQARAILLENSRPLSAEMLELVDGSWRPWCPPGEVGQKLRRLQRELLVGDYAQQKQALDSTLEKAGRDVFVATHSLVERKEDNQLISYAVLAKGVYTWLPKADLVCLLEGETADALFVSMGDFLACAGSAAKRLPYVLPRYEVQEFPDPHCMAQLRERATSIAEAKA